MIVRDHFDRPAGAVSLALAAYGAGSILTALALPRLLRRFNDRTVMLLAAFALSLILAAVAVLTARTPSTGTWAAALAAWAAIGAASSAVLTPGAQFSLSHTSPSRHTGTCAFGFAAGDTDDASSAGPCAGITRSVRA
ncbi:MFS transporter [Streptomyces globisporus]